MQYIALVSGKSDKVEYIKHVILESNPLLEAFGNAKTLRNNNSSRFFNKGGDPCGGNITTYLLEKSRVVFQGQGERCFHIFYNLLDGSNGTPQSQEWSLYTPDNFHYLNQSGCYRVDDMNDAQDYKEVRKAMTTVQMPEQEQTVILQLLAAILHIGNITFYEDDQGNSTVSDQNVLGLAAHLLRVDPYTLANAICFRVINTSTGGQRRSTYNVPQNVQQASAARDSLSKAIYSRIFDHLIVRVNQALAVYQMAFENVIGILDIYGFEIFNNNGFEQFCINYVNEKLQQYFIELTLKAEQEEYVREGIQWTPIQFFNNQIVCELIEGKNPPGIFGLLDDICFTVHAESGGTMDYKFLEKMQGSHGSHAHWEGSGTFFSIKHYAGKVTYNIEGFCDKNKDTLFNDLIETMQTSQVPFVVQLFPENTKQDQKKRPTTSGFKIKNSCNALMTALSQCTPHYIRCLKPNDNKKYHDWDQNRVRHQVQYLGLLENVRVRRAGFAYRAPFDRFVRRYKKLSDKTFGLWGEWTGDAREGCVTILRDIQVEPEYYQFGKTKIFIRHPETLFHLEECLERRDYEMTTRIQKVWRQWRNQKHALEQRAIAADLCKGKKERQRNSVERKYEGDYVGYANNAQLQAVLTKDFKGEMVVFADVVKKLNRKNKPEERVLLITETAFYLILKSVKKKQVIYENTRRTLIKNLTKISLTELSDNYFVIHVPEEYDLIFENPKKTEIVTTFWENFKAQTGRELPINFSNRIEFTLKGGKRLIEAQISPKDQEAKLKRGKNLKILIAQGLDRNTDTTPKGFVRGPAGSGRGGGRGNAAAMASVAGGSQPAPTPTPMPVAQPGLGPARAGPGPGRGGPGGPGPGGPGPGPSQTPKAAAMPKMAGPPMMGGPKAAGPGAGAASPPAAGRAGPAGPKGPGMMGGPKAAGPGPAGGGPKAAGRAGPPGPKAAPAKPMCSALYDYKAATDDELSFREGDRIAILQKDPGGWWEGELNGKRGWIPANYVQE